MKDEVTPRDFITMGYKAGIVLAFVGIVSSAVYLFIYLRMSPSTTPITNEFQLINATLERRMLLLSTAIFVGMSFGFLGFSLFLIQAKGDSDVEGSVSDYKLKIARLSPGLFVILCATIIIIVCTTFRIEYELSLPGELSTIKNEQMDTPNATMEDMGLPKSSHN